MPVSSPPRAPVVRTVADGRLGQAGDGGSPTRSMDSRNHRLAPAVELPNTEIQVRAALRL